MYVCVCVYIYIYIYIIHTINFISLSALAAENISNKFEANI